MAPVDRSCGSLPRRAVSAADRHALDDHAARDLAAAERAIGPHRDDVAVHLGQAARDGDLFHRVMDLALLDPETAGPAGVIAADVVDPLPDQFGDQEAG